VESPLVIIRDLQLQFRTYAGLVRALNGVDLEIYQGEMLGLVGETGCGKSLIGLSLLGLAPHGADIISGSILFEGENLLAKSESALQEIRGAKIAIIFQDPGASLNPLFTIGQQMELIMRRHQPARKKEINRRALELIEMVELPDPPQILKAFPYELSGGMKQRVCIAMGLSCGAKLLIADEPTTDLDVTVQAQILELLRILKETKGVAILLISHDLAVVAEACRRVAVLYAGRVVETGLTESVIYHAKHPYTQALLESSPRRDSRGKTLHAIPGIVASGLERHSGCAFRPRCPFAMEICRQIPPNLNLGEGHLVACYLYIDSRKG
jgi:oligopeptide/dipeptide ABC transporter ATP-binding protein